MPSGCSTCRVGSVGSILHSVAGCVAAWNGGGLGGSVCGEGVEATGLVHGMPQPVKTGRAGKSAEIVIGCRFFSGDGGRAGNSMSNPLKTGGAGRLAKTETGDWFSSGDDGRAGSLAKDKVGGSFFSGEE